ncbi:MAG: PAS domain-containing protein [Pseudomonadota bacterium]
MTTMTHHPNTQTLLSAWERMNATPEVGEHVEKASDHPDLLDCLFVIEQADEGRWLFRNAGNRLGKLLGRDLAQHDCLDFWTGHDRRMVESLIDTVRESRKPGILQATGETLTGTQVSIELTLAPLPNPRADRDHQRLLGLYQVLQPRSILKGRPVWRHRVTAVYPPRPDRQPAQLRLVASND